MDAYKRYLLEVIPKFNIETARKCVQFSLLLVNLSLTAMGTVFIVTCFNLYWFVESYLSFLGPEFYFLQLIFLSLGITMYIISFFGSIVAIKKSALIAKVYAAILLLLVIMELNAAITLFTMYGNMDTTIETNMQKKFNNQTVSEDFGMRDWDKIQLNLHCCGIHGPKDWSSLYIYGVNVDFDFSSEKPYTVPFSCCPQYTFSEQQSNPRCTNLDASGCLKMLRLRIGDSVAVLGLTTGVTLIIQVVGCLFAFILAKVIQRSRISKNMKKQNLEVFVCSNLHKSKEDKETLLKA